MIEKRKVDEINTWCGFQDYDGSDPNYIYEGVCINGKLMISVLMQAVEEGNVEIVSDLINEGADVNFICKNSQMTPLFYMDGILKDTPNKLKIASLLISNGADINFIREIDYGMGMPSVETLLNNACSFLNYDLVKLLIDSGAKWFDRIDYLGHILEHPYPSINMSNRQWNEFIKITDLLILKGLNINHGYGILLKYYIDGGQYIQANKLVALGANTEITPPERNHDEYGGQTALMVFLDSNGFHNVDESDNEKFFFKLWNRVINVNAQDDAGKSLLFYFIDEPSIGEVGFSIKIFDLIVNHNELDFNLQDNEGNTALNYLISFLPKAKEIDTSKQYSDFILKEAYQMLQMLILNTDISISNNNGESPKQFLDSVNVNYDKQKIFETNCCIICNSLKIEDKFSDVSLKSENIYLLNNEYVHYNCLERIKSKKTDLDYDINHSLDQISLIQNELLDLNSFVNKLRYIFDNSIKDRITSFTTSLNYYQKKQNEQKSQRELILLDYEKKLYYIYSYWLQRPPDWPQRRLEALAINEYCVKCGDFEQTLHVHHKRPISKGGDHTISNFEVLCENCHSEEHGGISFDYIEKLSLTESAFAKKYRKLREAVESKRQIKFKYYKYSGEMSMRTISPESFKKVGKSLCVEGFCFLRESNRVFNISRINNLTLV